ncbi:oxygen-evolving enhancer protein 3-2, chloroplastic-like [Rutidosis leptorrhynchoides]|uniref:oxygen-evolving enhancer protein 3-2, chloroplastic-like n=1 Tax=Rutidosis leptorrhynchoides TaxID=125765 RepID=UPI003A99E93B
MAQAVTSMAGLRGTSLAVTPVVNSRVVVTRTGIIVKAQQGESETSRRAMIGLIATGLVSGSFVQAVLADAKPIKLGPPPPPSGGLPGTENSDEARDLDLPLKKRFFLQPLTPTEAAARAKESAKEIINVKELIDKKAWPYVQNDLRSKSEYLRFDLNTIIASKPKDEKKVLKDLTGKLFQNMADLDYAAKMKSSADAEKSYAAAVSSLNDVLSKLG